MATESNTSLNRPFDGVESRIPPTKKPKVSIRIPDLLRLGRLQQRGELLNLASSWDQLTLKQK